MIKQKSGQRNGGSDVMCCVHLSVYVSRIERIRRPKNFHKTNRLRPSACCDVFLCSRKCVSQVKIENKMCRRCWLMQSVSAVRTSLDWNTQGPRVL